MKKNVKQVIESVNALVGVNEEQQYMRFRIRSIMDGGTEGMRALLGGNLDNQDIDSLPAPNLLVSGLDRLAQKISAVPDIRVDRVNDKDSERARKRAEKLERIVHSYDDKQKLKNQLGQISRWLPGYGYASWVIKTTKDADGNFYPYAELRDPYSTYPGHLGSNQQPDEIAYVRKIPMYKLVQIYPEHARALQATKKDAEPNNDGFYNVKLSDTEETWENDSGRGVVVVEYYDDSGMYIVVPHKRLLLDFVENPLKSGPQFVFCKRFSFNELKGQYDHVLGLMAQMAKINILSTIAMEDAVFTETNVSGELESGQYRKGRHAINYLAPGTQVSKPVNNLPYQLFNQVDRLERQLRLVAGYPVTDDAQSPNSFVTGRGLDELNASMSLMIGEYRDILQDALQELDAKRLEMDELMFDKSKALVGFRKGSAFSESYKPSVDIAKNYRTRRVYGVMAGFDEPQKIVTGLQLKQAGIIDTQTLQDNLTGLDNIQSVNERIRREKAETVLFETLLARANQGDQQAVMAVIEIYKNPDDMQSILNKFYTPEEPQLSPEEQALMGQMAPPDLTQGGLAQLALGGG